MIEFLFIAMLQGSVGDPQPAAAAAAAEIAAADSVRARRERHRIRCRDQVVLGSRMGHRVCMSQADEDAMREESQRIAEEMHRPAPFGEGASAGRCAEIGRNC